MLAATSLFLCRTAVGCTTTRLCGVIYVAACLALRRLVAIAVARGSHARVRLVRHLTALPTNDIASLLLLDLLHLLLARLVDLHNILLQLFQLLPQIGELRIQALLRILVLV